MSNFEKFLPDNSTKSNSSSGWVPVRTPVQALVNIAFATLASFAIVAAAVYAFKLILYQPGARLCPLPQPDNGCLKRVGLLIARP